jgi:hypothetical protein
VAVLLAEVLDIAASGLEDTKATAGTCGRTAMGGFVDVTLSRVPTGFDFAEPLRQLFDWVEEQGFFEPGRDVELYGTLNIRFQSAIGL